MTGTGKDVFSPYSNMTRGELVTVLYRLSGDNKAYGETTFKDVEKDKYYSNAVAWAFANEIAKGYNSECFGPEDLITREQVIAMIYRYAKFVGYDVELLKNEISRFADFSEISDYAVTPMEWAVHNGIIIGKDGNKVISSKADITRAECAAVMERFIKTIAK